MSAEVGSRKILTMDSNGGRVVDIPDHLVEHFVQYFTTFRNDTDDFRKPHLRRSIVNVYPLIVFLYAGIVLVGAASNVAVIVVIVRRRLHRDPTYFFVINLALSDIVKCVVVLPATLAVLLIQNWIFGRFLCYFIPMMQDIPIHASMLTYVTIALDRYRFVAYSSTMSSMRCPRCACAFGVWTLAVCVVLPYVFYIRYFDFETIIGPEVNGAVLCTVNVDGNIEEYMRGMFICMYVLPLTIVAFLYVRVDGELKVRGSPPPTTTTVLLLEMSSTCTDERSTGTETTTTTTTTTTTNAPAAQDMVQDSNDYDDDGVNLRKEKRNQKYLIGMVTLFATCLCPLKILGLAKHVTFETSENTSHFDAAFITFVWIGFLSTCTTPVLFASWRMSRSNKDRLRSYFRSSKDDGGRRPRRHSHVGRNNDGYALSPAVVNRNRLTVGGAASRRKSDEPAGNDRRHGQSSRSMSLV